MPDINVDLEHLAVDANGALSPEFYGYKKGMVWRRQLLPRMRRPCLRPLWRNSGMVRLKAKTHNLP